MTVSSHCDVSHLQWRAWRWDGKDKTYGRSNIHVFNQICILTAVVGLGLWQEELCWKYERVCNQCNFKRGEFSVKLLIKKKVHWCRYWTLLMQCYFSGTRSVQDELLEYICIYKCWTKARNTKSLVQTLPNGHSTKSLHTIHAGWFDCKTEMGHGIFHCSPQKCTTEDARNLL